jgi:N-acetylglucosaminyldiphosphoundecaprenol N-acetyl-beta-D-mannosaminyltransferase
MRTLPPDFSRDVRCVLGLPFDAVTLAATETALREAVGSRRRCFLSTPNLNFAIGCLDDAAFRASVLQSDLSIADGWPIVMLARLVGARLPERVAGSTLFERLVASSARPPLSVYFFGGAAGASEAACGRLNSLAGGVTCAGFAAPGFVSVEEMSTRVQIEHLNAARPDIVVVSVGAKKGQAWIQRNREQIDAPVVTYLGAVVNFVAGSLPRAPGWLQRCGLEWLWRIKEEPALWRRYASDGLALARLIATRALPLAVLQRTSASTVPAAAVTSFDGDGTRLRLAGAWAGADLTPSAVDLRQPCRLAPPDLDRPRRRTSLGPAAIALLSLLYGWQLEIGAEWKVLSPSGAAKRALRLSCADYLLVPHGTARPSA